MMRDLLCSLALGMSLVATPAAGQDLFTRKPFTDSYRGHDLPESRDRTGLPSLRIDRTSPMTSRGVYGADGRRLGTLESRPGGGAVLYGNDGRRRE